MFSVMNFINIQPSFHSYIPHALFFASSGPRVRAPTSYHVFHSRNRRHFARPGLFFLTRPHTIKPIVRKQRTLNITLILNRYVSWAGWTVHHCMDSADWIGTGKKADENVTLKRDAVFFLVISNKIVNNWTNDSNILGEKVHTSANKFEQFRSRAIIRCKAVYVCMCVV